MTEFAFLGQSGGLLHWILVSAHLPTTVLNWAVNVFLTVVVMGSVMRPLARRAIAAWRQHHLLRAERVAVQAKIANLLDTTTPGGLHPVVVELKRIVSALESIEKGPEQ